MSVPHFAPAVFAQPIVSRARPELLHSHFIPTIGRLRKRAGKVVAEEEQLRLEAKAEAEEGELLVRDEFSVLCRDLYALYPLLIRYVDNNRSACPQPSPTCPSLTSGFPEPHLALHLLTCYKLLAILTQPSNSNPIASGSTKSNPLDLLPPAPLYLLNLSPCTVATSAIRSPALPSSTGPPGLGR